MMMPLIAMVDANIQREELLPSEKAFAYKMWPIPVGEMNTNTAMEQNPGY